MCLPRSAFEKALIRVLEGNLPAETPDGIMAPHEKKRTVSTTKLLTRKARIITETWGLQSVEKISIGMKKQKKNQKSVGPQSRMGR
jgi:hypothetical protein